MKGEATGARESCDVAIAEFIIEGYQARDGTNKAVGRNFTLADGRSFLLGGSAPGAAGAEKP